MRVLNPPEGTEIQNFACGTGQWFILTKGDHFPLYRTACTVIALMYCTFHNPTYDPITEAT